MKVKEYSIQTKNFEEHFDDRQDAKEFWNNLSQQEKQSGQFFSKVWIRVDNDWIEDEVIILN
jgi:hypothetical protein|tara:strand:+ start:8103 stop:8288 length:186 start_codon:yes stop_codon:yes gene_type:complete